MITLSGTIRENLVFNSGDHVVLTEDVRLAKGYTLTWNEGSKLEGNSNSFEVSGTVIFNGDPASLIEVTNTYFEGSGGTLRLNYADVSNGSIFPTFGNNGSLSISYSVLQNLSEINNPNSTIIRGSILYNTSIDNTQSDILTLIDNTFIGSSKIVTTAWDAVFADSYISLTGNNFLVDGVALELSGFFSIDHDVRSNGNYWGSTSASVINSKIKDGNDDPDIKGVVDLTLKSSTYTNAPLELGKYFVNTTTGILRENTPTNSSEPSLIDNDGNLWDAAIDLGNGEIIEADNAQLYRAYYGALGRLPDEGGFDWWLNAINTGEHNLNSMAAGFIDSDEFQSMADSNLDSFLSNEEFINHMYTGVFGREPDAEGLAWWTGKLDSGAETHASAFIDMTQSNEYVELTLVAVATYDFL